jgi:hypothetical protein
MTLEEALRKDKKIISAENMNQNEFFYLDRYFTTMKSFSAFCQEQRSREFITGEDFMKLIIYIPEFVQQNNNCPI